MGEIELLVISAESRFSSEYTVGGGPPRTDAAAGGGRRIWVLDRSTQYDGLGVGSREEQGKD